MANILTLLRILLCIPLIFCPVFSPAFDALYIAAGLTDMLDGPIARKTHTASEKGARLDTIADLAFFTVCAARMLPVMNIPVLFLIWAGVIAMIKAGAMLLGFIQHRKLTAAHTLLNKVTGMLLFVLPMTINMADIRYSLTVVCITASLAAAEEWRMLR